MKKWQWAVCMGTIVGSVGLPLSLHAQTDRSTVGDSTDALSPESPTSERSESAASLLTQPISVNQRSNQPVYTVESLELFAGSIQRPQGSQSSSAIALPKHTGTVDPSELSKVVPPLPGGVKLRLGNL